MLILPGDPEFDLTLALARPPDAKEVAQTALDGVALVADQTGILRAVNMEYQLWDYCLGGEYDERMAQIGEEDALEDALSED